jgi:phosphoribosyl 1,2-cyclic phosphodiesterase
MAIELCILASGSSGNCAVVRTPAGVMLIDAGIGPRTCAKRLAGTGVSVGDIRDICLTHLDSDHFRTTWISTILQHQIRVRCHESRARTLIDMLREAVADRADLRRLAALVRPFGKSFEPLESLKLTTISLAHDMTGSHGFVIEGFGCRVGYATDLGRVPKDLIERFHEVDLIALESNYDTEMQRNSARPWFLKNRIMSGSGHLSNEQAFDAICSVLDRRESAGLKLPSHIVLLHRSRECNCTELMQKLFASDPRIAPRLTIADPHTRTEWLRPRTMKPVAGEQLAMQWE